MPYRFTFDLSRIPRFFFTEIAKAGYQKGMHKTLGKTVQDIIKKCRVQEATGLDLSDAVTLLQDLIDLNAKNLVERESFSKTKKRVLFLPHCSRKYLDNRCQASFDPKTPTFVCAHCSEDCLINKATSLAKKNNCDTYVVPGGSCIPKILKAKGYEGVVGVACGEEARLSRELLGKMGITGQVVPLIKNGCANTVFNMDSLNYILSQ